jgi:hypothetical protein
VRGLFGDDAVAEQVELGSEGKAVRVGGPALGKTHHPFDEVGGESSGVGLGGWWGGAAGEVFPAVDSGVVGAPPVGR